VYELSPEKGTERGHVRYRWAGTGRTTNDGPLGQNLRSNSPTVSRQSQYAFLFGQYLPRHGKKITDQLAAALRVPHQTEGKIRYRFGELAKRNTHRQSSEVQRGQQAYTDPGADEREQGLGAVHQDGLNWLETGLQENRASPFEITGWYFGSRMRKGSLAKSTSLAGPR
jgi:hypothetical protein